MQIRKWHANLRSSPHESRWLFPARPLGASTTKEPQLNSSVEWPTSSKADQRQLSPLNPYHDNAAQPALPFSRSHRDEMPTCTIHSPVTLHFAFAAHHSYVWPYIICVPQCGPAGRASNAGLTIVILSIREHAVYFARRDEAQSEAKWWISGLPTRTAELHLVSSWLAPAAPFRYSLSRMKLCLTTNHIAHQG
jgi:hypothetical protein